MSQILLRDVNTPVSSDWSVLHCEDDQKVRNYLKQDSIIILSREVYDKGKIFYNSVKAVFPEVRIGVLNYQETSFFVYSVESSELESFIEKCIRREYIVEDRHKILDRFLAFLDK